MLYYNEEKKLVFLESLEKNRERSERLLQIVARSEKKYGKDLSQFTEQEIEHLLANELGYKSQTVRPDVSIIRKYLKWCEANGETLCANSSAKFTIDTSARLREVMFSSPKHLQRVMDLAFHPIEDETFDCVYRCYLWLLYMTMPEADVPNVLTAEVDLDEMIVEHDGNSYEIYREAMPVFRKLVTLNELRHSPRYDAAVRRESPYLLRTPRAEHPGALSLRNTAFLKMNSSGVKSSYKKIRWSGIFYQLYEAERADADFGLKAGLNAWATRLAIEIRLEKDQPLDDISKSQQRIKSILKKDYLMWKKAFQ